MTTSSTNVLCNYFVKIDFRDYPVGVSFFDPVLAWCDTQYGKYI